MFFQLSIFDRRKDSTEIANLSDQMSSVQRKFLILDGIGGVSFGRELLASPAAPGRARVALVAFSSLGDGLLYLMMAENLRLNGYKLVYYGDIGHQLRHWLPQLDIRPYPPRDSFDATLADYDLAIVSPPHYLRDHMDEHLLDVMRRKWLLVCQRAPATWRHDLTEAVSASRAPEIVAELRDLLDSGGPIRFRKVYRRKCRGYHASLFARTYAS